MRPALCGPHASQPPAMSRALALALAPAPVRPARPRLGAARVPSDPPTPAVGCAQRAPPAGLATCSPSGLSSLSGAPRSSSPPPAIRLLPFRRSPKPAIQPAPAPPSVAALPLCGPAKSGASGAQHRRRKLDDSPPIYAKILGLGQRIVFFQVPRRLACSGPSETGWRQVGGRVSTGMSERASALDARSRAEGVVDGPAVGCTRERVYSRRQTSGFAQ
jgi:hypothetical protein